MPATPDAAKADADALRARLETLEAENARLRIDPQARRRRFSWRSASSAVLIVVAALLVPLAVAASWVRGELVDEQRFVATFAPLVDEAAVQHAVIDGVITVFDEHVDVAADVNALFDAVEGLGVSGRASAALDVLRGPAISGIENAVRDGVTNLVRSEQFADVWRGALTLTHRALVATVKPSDADRAVTVTSGGEVVLNLRPVIAEVRQHLVDRGVQFAARIPGVDRHVVLAQSDAIPMIAGVYHLATTLGVVLPIGALVVLALAIIVARRRRVAAIGAGLGVGLTTGTVWVLAAVFASALPAIAAGLGVPPTAAAVVYEHITADIRHILGALALVAVIVVALAGLTGSAAVVTPMSQLNSRIAGAVRLPPGAAWRVRLVSLRPATRAVLGAGTVAVLLVPAAPGVHAWVLGIALVLWWVLAVLEAEPSAQGAEAATA